MLFLPQPSVYPFINPLEYSEIYNRYHLVLLKNACYGWRRAHARAVEYLSCLPLKRSDQIEKPDRHPSAARPPTIGVRPYRPKDFHLTLGSPTASTQVVGP